VAVVSIAGACRRAPLHDEPGTAVLGAGGVRGADAGGVGGAAGQGPIGTDAAVDGGFADRVVDEPGDDGFSIGPIRETCPAAAPSQACPIERPVLGSACPVIQAICEYGGADVWCRDRWRCADNRTWQVDASACADRCPAATPGDGSACAVAAWCDYSGQTLCICEPNRGSWSCTSKPDPACPDLLPLHGSPCDQTGKSCAYGVCDAFAAMCCSGAWITGRAPCSE